MDTFCSSLCLFTYCDLGNDKHCGPAVDLDYQRVHLVHQNLLPLWALAIWTPLFAFRELVVFRDAVPELFDLRRLIQPDWVLVGPQEDGVLSVGTGGAAQPAGHDPPLMKEAVHILPSKTLNTPVSAFVPLTQHCITKIMDIK